MKRATVVLFVVVVVITGGIAVHRADAAQDASFSKYFPAGPMLYLEAKDFSSLLSDWNSSPEKKIWLSSSNYEVFSRSRLFLRLKGAGDQFAAAAGLPPDMDFASQVAGTRSALALYDIGNLQFLYITYLPSAKSLQTQLWQVRSKFEPRNAGGVTFYVRRDPESQKEVAFAVAGDYLLLATRADLLAGALQLISGNKDRAIETEPWFAQTVSAAKERGDLRMVLNLEKIVPSPYFRTYWAQQNITDMKQYSAAVSDLLRSSKEYREERVLIAKNAPAAESDAGRNAVADLIRFVPENSGVYQAKAVPSGDACLQLLETKILAPHFGPTPASELAPQVQLASGETGQSSDLETRIDQPPTDGSTSAQSVSALQQLLSKTQVLASLQVQATDRDPAGVFVRIHSAVALVAASDWSDADLRAALADFVSPSFTASGLGISWQQKSGYQELDGLWPLSVSVRGKYLLVADDPALLEKMIAGLDRKSAAEPARLIAGFDHARERTNFKQFFSMADRNAGSEGFSSGTREPQFFSENMASLSQVFANISSEKILERRDGDKILQTVTYDWSK
ncbi:MAG: hypothetical protein DMG93_02695 [Acidobacteria bacterium]|nr:MAG: hypothetical protein DMG93_02695 [Acidobacteriota bacterium]